MRLAVVSPFLDRQHGTELCISEQIERLARQDGWSIDLYAQKVSQVKGLCPASEIARNPPGSIAWHKVAAIPGPHLFRFLWWFIANHWKRWLDRRSGRVRPDLVYSPGINCMDADVIVVHIVFHAFYERIRAELALTSFPLQNWPLLIHRKLYYKLIMFLERKIYRGPSVHLVAVSSLVAAQLKVHFQRDDATVIPDAVDTSKFRPETRIAKRQSSRQTLNYSEDDFGLLLIGNDWKKKGLDTVLKALALLIDLPLRLLVVGRDDPRLYSSLLDKLTLQGRIRFEKPSPDVLSFYAAADLYLGPSLEDAFNLPILEAMACGLPVIASAQSGASEIIRDWETGIILRDPRDHVKLAQLIRRVYEDRVLRPTMGELASRDVQTICSWEENTEKTRKFLEITLAKMSKN